MKLLTVRLPPNVRKQKPRKRRGAPGHLHQLDANQQYRANTIGRNDPCPGRWGNPPCGKKAKKCACPRPVLLDAKEAPTCAKPGCETPDGQYVKVVKDGVAKFVCLPHAREIVVERAARDGLVSKELLEAASKQSAEAIHAALSEKPPAA